MAKKTIVTCDITGDEDAKTFTYPTGEWERDIAGGATEQQFADIDLSLDGALFLLRQVAKAFEARHAPPLSVESFSAMIRHARKSPKPTAPMKWTRVEIK